MPNNKLLLTIAGLSILINTSEDEAYARELAGELDRDISTILNANTGASVTNASLLCAIDYLDSAKKSAKNANNMRNQVKDYMDDAAKAKFKFDEEHKRANELAVEIQSLRSHLTRLATEGDSSGVVENIKSELAAATQELAELRDKAGRVAAANKSLNEKSAAMSDYIAGQDKEIARLGSITGELNATIAQKDEQLAALAARIESITADNRALKNDNARLNTELYTMEQTMNDDRAKARELAAQLASLRLEAEAARSDAEAAAAELAALKANNFAAPDTFNAPLSDELEHPVEPNPVLFDYEAPAGEDFSDSALGFETQDEPQPDEGDEMGQMRFDEPEAQSVPVVEQDAPIVFDGFQISDDFSQGSDAHYPDQPMAQEMLEPQGGVSAQPQADSYEGFAPREQLEADGFATFGDPPQPQDGGLFGAFGPESADRGDDSNMPDLSWTLEV